MMENEVVIPLFAIPVTTLGFKKRLLYRLSDMAYGEWLIFQNDIPKYYLNIFDKIYEGVTFLADEDGSSFENRLEKLFKERNLNLSLSPSFKWMLVHESKQKVIDFHIEKYPPSYF